MRDGIERSWWTDVEPDEVESELAWLREAVYEGRWGYLPPGGIPPTARDGVRSLAGGSECDLAQPAAVHSGARAPFAA